MDRDNTGSKKLKIAMLGHKRVPSREGGVEIMVGELVNRMVAEGHSVTYYNRRGHHMSGAEFNGRQLSEYKGIKIKTVPTVNRRGLTTMTSSLFAAAKAAFSHYDIIHIHTEGPATICWIPRLCRKMVVVTVHGLNWKREKRKGGFGSRYIEFDEKCTVRFADQIIVLSEGVQDCFMDTYSRKAVPILNGVNRPIGKEPDEIRKRWGLEKDSYILFLGRLAPEKGLRYLVEAYKGLKAYKKLVIAGGSSGTDAFAEELKRPCTGLEDNVVFTDLIQGKTLDELCGSCYLYVLPSDLEGMPLSLLEAMSYGNCCVVSDIEECKSMITDTNSSQSVAVFRRSGVEDLTGKLRILLDNDTLVQKYKDEAADYICEKYGWDKVAEKTVGVHRKADTRR